MKAIRQPDTWVLGTVLVCICVALLALQPVAHGAPRQAASQRPNIVFVFHIKHFIECLRHSAFP